MKWTVVVAAFLPALALAQGDAHTLKVFEQRQGPGGYILITLASRTVIAVMPSDLDGKSLKTTRVEQTCVPAARLTLASAIAVMVPLADLVDGSTIGQRSPAECRQAVVGTAPRSLPSDTEALSAIRSKCASQWTDDFQMRNFCEEQQLKALEELRRR